MTGPEPDCAENARQAAPPEAGPEPETPSVTVVLIDDQHGVRVADVRGEGGITLDSFQFWLEEAIRHVRRARGLS